MKTHPTSSVLFTQSNASSRSMHQLSLSDQKPIAIHSRHILHVASNQSPRNLLMWKWQTGIHITVTIISVIGVVAAFFSSNGIIGITLATLTISELNSLYQLYKNKDAADLEANLRDLRKTNEQTQIQLNALQGQNAQLKSQTADQVNQVSALRRTVGELSQTRDGLNRTNQDLVRDISILRNEKEAIEKNNIELNKKIETFKKDTETLHTQVQELFKFNENAATQLNVFHNGIQNFITNNSTLQQQLASIDATFDEDHKQFASDILKIQSTSDEIVKFVNKQSDLLKHEAEHWQLHSQKLQSQITEMENKIQDLNAIDKNLELKRKEYLTLENDIKKNAEMFQKEIIALSEERKKLAEIKSQFILEESKLEKVKVEINTINDKFLSIEKQIAEKITKLEELKKEIKNAKLEKKN